MPAIMTHGIPMRFWNHREEREETVYLATLRSGAGGQRLRELRREHDRLATRVRRGGRDLPLISAAIREDMTPEKLRDSATEQDVLVDELRTLDNSLQETAADLVKSALTLCHGADEAERVLDCLSDRQVEQAVRMLDLGCEPADFFDGRAIRSTAPGTGPGGATSGGCSSRPATAAAISPTPIS